MKLLQLVEREWALQLRDPRLLAPGYQNVLVRVDSRRGPLVVRVLPERVDERALAWQHELVAALGAEVPEVTAPLPARDGTTWRRRGGRLVTVLPFVPGEPLDRNDDRHRAAAARTLARLHRTGASLRLSSKPAPPPFVPVEVPELVGVELREGPLHGDYYRGNVLWHNDRVSGVVDWDEAHVGAFAWELARATWEFAHAGQTFDRAAAERFVATYLDAGGPVADGELRYFVPLMRKARLEDAAFNRAIAHKLGFDDAYSREQEAVAERLRHEPPLRT